MPWAWPWSFVASGTSGIERMGRLRGFAPILDLSHCREQAALAVLLVQHRLFRPMRYIRRTHRREQAVLGGNRSSSAGSPSTGSSGRCGISEGRAAVNRRCWVETARPAPAHPAPALQAGAVPEGRAAVNRRCWAFGSPSTGSSGRCGINLPKIRARPPLQKMLAPEY